MAVIRDLVLFAGAGILAGQGADRGGLPADWTEAEFDGRLWTDGGWQPLNRAVRQSGAGFGLELLLARQLRNRTRRPVDVVKVAEPGATLRWDWDIGGPLFTRLVAEARAATRDVPLRYFALVWMPDDMDPGVGTAAPDGDAPALIRMVDALRNELGAPDLSVIVVEPSDLSMHPQVLHRPGQQPPPKSSRILPCETWDLRRASNGMQFTSNGLWELGRRLTDALAELPRRRGTRWIWQSDRYQCWYEGPLNCSRAVVALPHALPDDGFEAPAFAQMQLEDQALPAVLIRSRQPHWFQDDEILKLAAAIRAALPDGTRIATYGYSMGGYGALLLSGPLQAERVISVAPQYTLEPAVVPFEHRWRDIADKIGPFCHRLENHIVRGKPKHMVYDPRSDDRTHADMMPKGADWHHLGLPFCSHDMLDRMGEAGALPLLTDGIFGDGPDPRAIRRRLRDSRRASPLYWSELARRAHARRPALATEALDRALETGGLPQDVGDLRARLGLGAETTPPDLGVGGASD